MAANDSDSGSESDGGGEGVGNVNRAVVRPPGQSGKAKKGHLIFDAAFEGGNLGRVDYISEYEYDLFIRPDTCNPRFRVWFHFTAENVRLNQKVIFNIVNISKDKALYREGMSPLVKSTSRPKWRKIPSRFVYYYISPEHKNNYVLSFLFGFDREDDIYHFAYSYPYSYSRLQTYVDELGNRKYPYLTTEVIGKTLQQRPVSLLTIGGSGGGEEGKKRRTVVITSRVHPGETPASFVVQGLVDFLLSDYSLAKILRNHVVFKIVPMLNPDGVFLGNYRTSMMGFDLNRNWQESSPWAHPTIHATKTMIQELDADPDVELDFVMDIHAHSSLVGAFIYGNHYDDVYRSERHALFPKLLGQVADDFSPSSSHYNKDPLKSGTARRHFASVLHDKVNCYTLEVSFYGYYPNNGAASMIMPYTDDGYMRLGRNLARAFYDYYRVTNHIPAAICATVSNKEQDRARLARKTKLLKSNAKQK